MYGIINLIAGVFFLLTIGNVSLGNPFSSNWTTIFLLVSIAKLFLVPFIGLIATRRYLSSLNDLTGTSKNGLVALNGSPTQAHASEKVRPTPPTFKILTIGFFILVLLPISPAFIGNLQPSPAISGPYITRLAPSHGMQALQYVEGLSPEDLGSPIRYVVVNDSLNFFLRLIRDGTSLEGQAFRPYIYSLNWTVSIEEALVPILNSSSLHGYWIKNFDPNYLTRLMWWENGTRIDLGAQEDSWISDLNQTSFQDFSYSIFWVFSGEVRYSEVFGELGANFIHTEQMFSLMQIYIQCVAPSWSVML
ncbi:MAG: hypothetical protein ACFFE8_15790 [Candidatus Heimdallarchaeota archaeon]